MPGLGTSRDIYAQIVDLNTGRTLGNLVTPIPVRLDGGTHTVTVSWRTSPIRAPRRRHQPGRQLALQIVDSATAYENFTSFGVVNVSGISLALPTAANVIDPAAAAGRPRATSREKREPQTLQDLILERAAE